MSTNVAIYHLPSMPGATSAQAVNLTCKEWFDYGKRSYLPHGKSEAMASTSASIEATFNTMETVRVTLAIRAHQPAPPRRNLADMRATIVSACERMPDRQVSEVLTAVRDTLIELDFSVNPPAGK